MFVLIGNATAREPHRDQASDDPEKVLFRPLPGERVTELKFPPGTSVPQAYNETIAALGFHMEPGSVPVWIETDNAQLKKLLLDHWGLTATKAKRPAKWGEATGADQFLLARAQPKKK